MVGLVGRFGGGWAVCGVVLWGVGGVVVCCGWVGVGGEVGG